MEASPAIEVRNVGKRFRLRRNASRSLKGAALECLRPGRGPREEFWAVRDLSFSVAPGETLGIIGANGAGKSTLLSLLAKTKEPTVGEIRVRGQVSSLLELGAGFHPDLTGRENVFLAGAIMGLTRQQMRARMESIVAFAGIEDFIDQPVKHYSSGMYVRLGFAVAVEVDPDILLIDEVLAVGDVNFQRRCIEKMEAFRREGKTLLIISHDLPTIQSISDRILLLDHGTIQGLGPPDAVMGTYRSLARQASSSGLEREWGTGEVRIEGVDLLDARGAVCDCFRQGEPLQIRIQYRAETPVEEVVFGFGLSDDQGRLIFGSNTQVAGLSLPRIEGAGALTLRLEDLPMASGNYLLSFSVHSADHQRNYHRLDHAFGFVMENQTSFEGVCHMPHTWEGTAISGN